MSRFVGVFVFVAVSVASARLHTTTYSGLRLEIGAAVPVSEPHLAFAEPFVAADPTDAQRLVVSVSQIDPRHGVIPRAFTSSDGGRSWTPSALADPTDAVTSGRVNGIEDMWTAIGARGTAYISMLAIRAPNGSASADAWSPVPLLVVRSDDAGARWSPPTVLRTESADAPKIAVWQDSVVVLAVQVDASDTVAHAPNESYEHIAAYRSTDGARTFLAARFLAFDDLGHNPLNPVLLPDGVLLVTWMDHPHYGRNGPDQHLGGSRIEVARSPDGGDAFELPHAIADVQRAGFPAVLRMVVDDGAASPRRGRVYVVWNGGIGTHSDLSLSSSDDGGRQVGTPARDSRRRRRWIHGGRRQFGRCVSTGVGVPRGRSVGNAMLHVADDGVLGRRTHVRVAG